MSKSQNIADTIKWKKKRKDHDGDRCDNAKCGICSSHKYMGNSNKKANKKKMLELEIIKQSKNEYI